MIVQKNGQKEKEYLTQGSQCGRPPLIEIQMKVQNKPKLKHLWNKKSRQKGNSPKHRRYLKYTLLMCQEKIQIKMQKLFLKCKFKQRNIVTVMLFQK